MQYSTWGIIFLFVPVFEFILYPLVLKCKSCINIGILQKLFFGVLLVFIFEIGRLTLDIKFYSTLTITNHNDTCSLGSNEVNLIDGELHADYKLLFAKQLFIGVALYIFLYKYSRIYLCIVSILHERTPHWYDILSWYHINLFVT